MQCSTDVLGTSDIFMTSKRFAPLCKLSLLPSYLRHAVVCSHPLLGLFCLCFRFVPLTVLVSSVGRWISFSKRKFMNITSISL
jgi:hypothetical protein